jgi:hypothetical protein
MDSAPKDESCFMASWDNGNDKSIVEIIHYDGRDWRSSDGHKIEAVFKWLPLPLSEV